MTVGGGQALGDDEHSVALAKAGARSYVIGPRLRECSWKSTPTVSLVTGASRGVGRGIALGLLEAGSIVYATGRTIAQADLPPEVIRVPRWRWDAMMTAGVRAAFVASQLAAARMVPRKRGLIVNVSVRAAQKHSGNVVYGVSKAATDKLTSDMAHELEPHGVTVVSLYPGLVRTEAVLAAGVFDLSNSESPQFLGRVIAALAGDPNVGARSGQVLVAAAVAREYGLTDVDGKSPRPLTLADV
jgi:NAD(P)-dependent dehydrogenase (short-subunit alcohol dehydrogenase family)